MNMGTQLGNQHDMKEFPKFSKIEEIIYHLPLQLVPGQGDPLQKIGFSELKEDIYLVNY